MTVLLKDAVNPPSDRIYQLHGYGRDLHDSTLEQRTNRMPLFRVVVLEEVDPIHRFLLYLRPRTENQRFLFFNEEVSHASESEVFELNFRLNNGAVPVGAPLRTPVLLLYLRVSMLDSLLG